MQQGEDYANLSRVYDIQFVCPQVHDEVFICHRLPEKEWEVLTAGPECPLRLRLLEHFIFVALLIPHPFAR